MKRVLTFILLVATISTSAQIFERNDDNRKNRNSRNNDFMLNRRRAPALSMGVQISNPTGEFGDLYSGTPAGFNGLFTVNWGRTPFEFGFGAAWNSMGSQKQDIIINIGQDVNGFDIYNDGKMTVKSNIYSYHAIGRFKPIAGPIQPYVDVLGGFKTFSSKSIIKEDGESEAHSEDRESRDFALSSGWAAGIKIRINDYMMGELRFTKLRGGEVDFIDPESLEIGFEGDLEYDLIQTKTNTNGFHFGISVEF